MLCHLLSTNLTAARLTGSDDRDKASRDSRQANSNFNLGVFDPTESNIGA